jgi:unspecific monooxygenase
MRPLLRILRPARRPVPQHTVRTYGAVRTVLADPARYSSRLLTTVDRSIVSLDPPDHDAPRQAVRKVLSPTRVKALEDRAREVAGELLTVRGDDAELDLMARLATPLPEILLAEIIGLPGGVEPFGTACRGESGEATPEAIRSAVEALPELPALLADLVEEHGLDAGHAQELVEMLWLAGTITTRRAIGSAALLLGRDVALRAQVESDRRAIDSLVEEAIRLDPPEPLLLRMADSEASIEGTALAAGATVTLDVKAANRDPSRFERAAAVDLERPTRHLSFGAGTHRCPGASLARLEVAAAVGALLDHMPGFRLLETDATLRYGGPTGKALERLLVAP